MSITYHVAVPQYRWPTFAFLNDALAARGYPLYVHPIYESDDGAPLGTLDIGEPLRVRLLDEEMELDVFCRPIGHHPQRHVSPEEVNELLIEIGSEHRVTAENWEYTSSFGSSIKPKYLVPHQLLLGVLVKDFGGYGYEGQASTFGRDEWAAQLLAEAEATIARLRATPLIEEDAPAIANGPEQPQKPLFTFWRVLTAVVVLLFVAEFIDKNIYNFTPALTGADQGNVRAEN